MSALEFDAPSGSTELVANVIDMSIPLEIRLNCKSQKFDGCAGFN